MYLKNYIKIMGLILSLSLFFSCGSDDNETGGGGGGTSNVANVPVDVPLDDGIIKGRAELTVEMNSSLSLLNKLFDLIYSNAIAATGSYVVTYTNAVSTNFSLNTSAFGPNGFTGDTLSLGSVSLATLDDNSLKVCGVSGNQKCLKGIIRMYTTGSVTGFVNTDDGTYGSPVYAGTLNPSTALGLNTVGSVQVQVVNIAANKNRLRLSDFPTPTYSVTSDFSNSGSGAYSMTLVVEYILSL